jgi:hypothetical protein
MEVFHIADKGRLLDTLGKFYIYVETQNEKPNQRQTYSREKPDLRGFSLTSLLKKATCLTRLDVPNHHEAVTNKNRTSK